MSKGSVFVRVPTITMAPVRDLVPARKVFDEIIGPSEEIEVFGVEFAMEGALYPVWLSPDPAILNTVKYGLLTRSRRLRLIT